MKVDHLIIPIQDSFWTDAAERAQQLLERRAEHRNAIMESVWIQIFDYTKSLIMYRASSNVNVHVRCLTSSPVYEHAKNSVYDAKWDPGKRLVILKLDEYDFRKPR